MNHPMSMALALGPQSPRALHLGKVKTSDIYGHGKTIPGRYKCHTRLLRDVNAEGMVVVVIEKAEPMFISGHSNIAPMSSNGVEYTVEAWVLFGVICTH